MLVSEQTFQALVKGNKPKALIGSPFLLRYSLSCNHHYFYFFFFFFSKKQLLNLNEENC